VTARHADAVLPFQQWAQEVEALHYRDAGRPRGRHFRVVIGNGRRDEHEIGAGYVLALVAAENRRAVARQLIGGVVGALIGTGHAEAHLQQQLGDRGQP